jgi:hypothetical protein
MKRECFEHMTRTTSLGSLLSVISCAVAMSALARADVERGTGYFAQPVRAAAGAVEVSLENHYSQGVGLSAQGVRATDLTREGIGLGLMAGYRISPTILLGFGVRYDQFAAGEELVDPGNGHGWVAGPTIVYHFNPSGRVDPWWLGGVGYRTLSIAGETPGHPELWRGFELARAVIGVDLRLDDRVALGPLFGADISMFGWRDVEGVGTEAIRGKRPEVFFEAGLQARIEFGTGRPPPVIASGK